MQTPVTVINRFCLLRNGQSLSIKYSNYYLPKITQLNLVNQRYLQAKNINLKQILQTEMLRITSCLFNNQFNNKLAYAFSFNYPCPRKLREVVKISMFQKQPAHQIKNIWKQYHQKRPANISQSLDKEKYLHLLQRFKKAPMFLLPIYRKGGHFKILTQWQDNCFLCTSLEDYKRYGARSSPYIVFTLFSELLFLKGIVLARGDIVNNMLTKLQAQQLWHLLQSSYQQQQKFQLVDNFNNNASLFDEKKFNELYRLQ